MQNYDLDAHILIIGQARSGKSTLSLRFLERIYSIKHDIPLSDVDNFIVNRDFFNKNMIYNPNQKLDLVKQNFKDVIITDEAFLVADKRESMTGTNIKYTKMLNVFANRNNIVFTNMQDFTELDARIRKKANLIILITQRGLAYSYLQSVNLPIVKQPSIFEFFEDNPYFLYSSQETIDWTLRHRIRGFIGIIKWQPFDANSPLWKAYNEAKIKYQNDLDLSPNEIKEVKQAPQQSQIPKEIQEILDNEYIPDSIKQKYLAKLNTNKNNEDHANIDNKKENETPPTDKFTYRCSYCSLTFSVAKNETPPEYCPRCKRRALKLIAKPIE